MAVTSRIEWSGEITSVQPRIRLLRSFDQRHHAYLGYALRIRGVAGTEKRDFWVGIGKGAHQKHLFKVGDCISGMAQPVADSRLESVEFYKASKIQVEEASPQESTPPPWHGVPPTLEEYRARGHRRLSARTYDVSCSSCIWGCRMPVSIIVDQWNPGQKKYRFETFCYGPKSCRLYSPGPNRKVEGRKGMVWKEEDWVDKEAVGHRAMDE